MVATFGSNPVPSILFNQLNDLSNLHSIIVVPPQIPVNFYRDLNWIDEGETATAYFLARLRFLFSRQTGFLLGFADEAHCSVERAVVAVGRITGDAHADF